MPELPDVELYRRLVARQALHRTVSTVTVRSSKVLDGVSGRSLNTALRGRRFATAGRRGKYLFVDIDGGPLLRIHFGMSGAFAVRAAGEDDGRYDRVLFAFDDGGRLCYVSKRQLGSVALVRSVDQAIEQLELGPDALEIPSDDFDTLVRSSSGMVKSLLMDQRKIAGIGNIYSDEILFQARIHPKTRCEHIDRRMRGRLWRAMHRVLETAIRQDALPGRMPRSFLLPRRAPGETCPRCGGKIRTVSASGRHAYLCPRCQPPPS